jgi:hypothetical protein
MKVKVTHIIKKTVLLGLVTTASLIWITAFAQNTDSLAFKNKAKSRQISKLSTKNTLSSTNTRTVEFSQTSKHDKPIIIQKIYPMPLTDQINISFKLSKENQLSIKITDLLGNEVATLTNEKFAAGDYLKSYNLPPKLNSGIYFLRIVAGNEPLIKRISIL